MSMEDLYKECTVDCEGMPECVVCGQRKAPHGRSTPLGSYYCGQDCPAYYQAPRAGHLWPGELARIRADGEED